MESENKQKDIEDLAIGKAKETQGTPNDVGDSYERFKEELEKKQKLAEETEKRANIALEKAQKAIAILETRGRSFAGQEQRPLTEKEKIREDIRKIFPKESLPKNLQ